MDTFLTELLIDLQDLQEDILFDYDGKDNVPYQKLQDIIENVEHQLSE